MTNSALAAIPGAPSRESYPPYEFSHGHDALELAASAGMEADPWQAQVIVPAMGARPDGQWSAFEAAVMVSRQNGKGSVLEILCLAHLYLLGTRLVTWTAHQFDTSLEAFRRLLELTEEADLQREIKRVSRSHGEEGLELRSGQRIRFRTRTKGGGRGFSGGLLIYDEAMILPESTVGATFPTLSAQPNPQVWYAGSAVDQDVHEHGVVFARLRERGRRGDDRSLAWFEWSLDADNPGQVTPEVAEDQAAWAAANPSLDIRITREYVANERRTLSPRTFAVERLGVGDWPSTSGQGQDKIQVAAWDALADPGSRRDGPVCFTFDVNPDRSRAVICVAGQRSDGLDHVEVVEYREGTGWLVDRLVELDERHEPEAVLCDGRGPAASFIADLDQRGVTVEAVDGQELARACGSLVDAVEAGSFRHLGTPEVRDALRGAGTRPLGDSWAWARKTSAADICPLVAFTLARRKAELMRASVYEGRGVLTITMD